MEDNTSQRGPEVVLRAIRTVVDAGMAIHHGNHGYDLLDSLVSELQLVTANRDFRRAEAGLVEVVSLKSRIREVELQIVSERAEMSRIANEAIEATIGEPKGDNQ